MKINAKIHVLASLLTFLEICGISYAESSLPLVLQYELPFNESAYSSHYVTFTHATHAMKYKITCIQCHHTLEQGAIAVEETCRDCHKNTGIKSFAEAKNVPDEKRKDYYFIAIHGQCVNCHKEVKNHDEGANAPVGCWRCHVRKQREN